MRVSLATRIMATITAVLALAATSGVVSLVLIRQFQTLVTSIVDESLPSLRAATELEVALLDQRGLVSAYILDNGNPRWRQEMARRRQTVEHSLEETRRVALSPEGIELLDDLDQVQTEYNARRIETMELFDAGDTEGARRKLLIEVATLHEQARGISQAFLLANDRLVDLRIDEAGVRLRQATITVIVYTVLTIILSAWLLWMFFHDLLLPIRRLAAMAQTPESLDATATDDETGAEGELAAIGRQLRALMSDVATTRSHLQQSQTDLMQAEKLASVGKLAASVAHEIRNPLTAIKMWLFSIRQATGDDQRTTTMLDVVAGEIARLETIVRSFLEFSRPPSLKPYKLSISTLIEKTLELFHYRLIEHNVELVRDEPTDLPLVMVDPDQLKQVFVNLLDNALQQMGRGGKIWLSASSASDSDGTPMVVLRMRDSGPGMTDDVRQRIFEPFFTAREGGTGLGLSIAASIMARHGGRLVLESTSSEGTEFAVWIPAARGE